MKKSQISVPVTWSTVVLFAVIIIASIALLILSNGNVGAAVVPALAIAGGIALFALPLRHTMFAFYTIAMVVSDPAVKPMERQWTGPLTQLGAFVFSNVSDIAGVGGLSFSLAQLIVLIFLSVVTLRTLVHNNIDEHLTRPAAHPMKIAVIVSCLAAILFVLKGIFAGGMSAGISWQGKMFIITPLMTITFMRAFKTEEVFRRMGIAVVVACVIRIIEGGYFFLMIRPSVLREMEYIMTHNDSVVFVVGFMVLVIAALEQPTRKNIRNLIVWGGIIQWGLLINDRRVAYVGMVICLIVTYFYLRPAVRKKFNRVMVYILPVLVLYVGAGLNSGAGIFAPVHSITSVSDKSDASNLCRDFENFDMISTLAPNPVTGTGFGFPYLEIIEPCRLPYEGFQYLAHNHILWLAYLTGMVGFYLIWLQMPVGTFLAFRSLRYAVTPHQRMAGMVVLYILCAYMVQAFGDMGTIGWKPNILLSAMLAIAANNSKRTNGYP